MKLTNNSLIAGTFLTILSVANSQAGILSLDTLASAAPAISTNCAKAGIGIHQETGTQIYKLELSETEKKNVQKSLDAGDDAYFSLRIKESAKALNNAEVSYAGVLCMANSEVAPDSEHCEVLPGDVGSILDSEFFSGYDDADTDYIYRNDLYELPIDSSVDLDLPIYITFHGTVELNCLDDSTFDQGVVSLAISSKPFFIY